MDWIKAVWGKLKPILDRVDFFERALALAQFVVSVVTNRWVQVVVTLVIIGGLSLIESIPLPLLVPTALFSIASLLWIRQRLAHRTELQTLIELLKKPPKIQTKYEFLEPTGWHLLSKVRDRNRSSMGRYITRQNSFTSRQDFDAAPPRILIYAKYWNVSIYDWSMKSIEGSVRLTDISTTGVVNERIELKDVEVLTQFMLAQSQFDFYIAVEIAFETTFNRVKALIEKAENPEWELSGLKVWLHTSDDVGVEDVALYLGESHRSLLKRGQDDCGLSFFGS